MIDTDATAMINVIRSFEPVVIVDESHNAATELSVSMLADLNPSFVLELTATPRNSSNIISYVDALQLKKQQMVKLPVIVNTYRNRSHTITTNSLSFFRAYDQPSDANSALWQWCVGNSYSTN